MQFVEVAFLFMSQMPNFEIYSKWPWANGHRQMVVGKWPWGNGRGQMPVGKWPWANFCYVK